MKKDPRDRIRDPHCELCPLHKSANFVCLMGAGHPTKSKIMIVGEAPGAREDQTHQAFVGAAGKLLDSLLKEAAQLTRDECYITNVAKCRPPDNRTPDKKEIKVCVENYFIPELEMVDPEFVLTLGNSALYGVVGKSGIMKHRGTTYDSHGMKILPTIHPAAVLRNPKNTDLIVADFRRFGQMVRGESTSPNTDVKIIRTPKQLKWLLDQLAAADTIVFDLETYGEGDIPGFEEWHGDKSKIASVSFTWESGQGAVVPLYHKSDPWKGRWLEVWHKFKPYLEDPSKKIVNHNLKFDARWAYAKGIEVPQQFCTMLAAHMLDENRSKGLKPLSQILLGADAYDVGEEIGNAPQIKLRKLAVYNAKDTDYTYRLYQIFRRQLAQEPRIARVFKLLMMPASEEFVKIENRGIKLDMERWEERYEHAIGIIDKLERYMKRTMPKEERKDFNFNSPQQVATWLYDWLELECLELTKKGKPSTKESVLLQLAKQNDAVRAMLKYRKWAKFVSTYLGPWGTHHDEFDRIHPEYNLPGTVTGRLSAKGSIQQVPRDPFIRSLFCAEDGWLFIDADYSQIELRIAAMLAHERRMLRVFAAGGDPHMDMACDITGKVPEQVTKEERKLAKSVNFGYLYGMGHKKFVEYARDNYDVAVSEREAKKHRDTFFRTWPQLIPWHSRQRRLVHRYQRVSSPIGRVRHLPDIVSGDRDVVAEAERQAINSPVQSMASDLMLMSIIRIARELPESKVRVVGSIHDSILMEVKEEHADKMIPRIVEIMTNPPVKKQFGCDLTVPVEVELKYGTHWGEGEVWE